MKVPGTTTASSPVLLASLLLLATLPAALAQRDSNKGGNGAAFTAAPQPLHPDADLLLSFRASLENGEEKLPDWKRDVSPCYWWARGRGQSQCGLQLAAGSGGAAAALFWPMRCGQASCALASHLP